MHRWWACWRSQRRPGALVLGAVRRAERGESASLVRAPHQLFAQQAQQARIPSRGNHRRRRERCPRRRPCRRRRGGQGGSSSSNVVVKLGILFLFDFLGVLLLRVVIGFVVVVVVSTVNVANKTRRQPFSCRAYERFACTCTAVGQSAQAAGAARTRRHLFRSGGNRTTSSNTDNCDGGGQERGC